jgi:dolichol-phosphate mannosyltransferase
MTDVASETTRSALRAGVESPVIAVVLPCYRVTRHILGVLSRIGPEVSLIYVVDDRCPDGSGRLVETECRDPRVRVIYQPENTGVGGAVIAGYRAAAAEGAEIIVKIDGDGQMDPALLPRFVAPIAKGDADYTKGTRFHDIEAVRRMPHVRLVGNAGLSFMAKLSTGYWGLFDPNNGYTAIHANVLQLLPLEKIDRRYFFESDLLFRLNTIRAVVVDVPMEAVYADEVSNLDPKKELLRFSAKHLRTLLKRIFYNYFLRSFSIASLELVLGLLLVVFGFTIGSTEWIKGIRGGYAATAGTVMLAAMPLIIGVQLLLSFLGYDMSQTPSAPLHPRLFRRRERLGAGDAQPPALARADAALPAPAATLDPAQAQRRGPWLGAGLAALFAVLAFRVLWVQNAVCFHDEYVYRAASDRFLDRGLLFARQLIPEIPNRLYLLLIGVHSYFGENGYVVAGLLNVCAYLAAALPLLAISRRIGLSGSRQTVAVLVCLALPFSLYTKYFMPEAWYIAPFLAAQAALLKGLVLDRRGPLAWAGAWLGLLYLVKPHASVALGAALVVLVVVAIREGRVSKVPLSAMVLLGFFGVTAFGLGSLLVDPARQAQIAGVYGQMATGASRSTLLGLLQDPWHYLGTVAYVAWGHAMFVGFLYGLPLVATVAALRRREGAAGRATSSLAVLALVNLVVLAGMSVFFTTAVGEAGRIHLRYYGFVLCLPVMLLFAPPAPARSWQRVLAAGVVGALVVACLLGYQSYGPPGPQGLATSTTTDSPDAAIVHLSAGWLALLALLPLAAAGMLAIGNGSWRRVALGFVVVFSLVDAVALTRELTTTFNADFVRGEEARLAEGLVPASQRDEVLVVGQDRDEVSKFLFWYRATPWTLFRPRDGELRAEDIPAHTRWLIALNDTLAVRVPVERVTNSRTFSFYRVCEPEPEGCNSKRVHLGADELLTQVGRRGSGALATTGKAGVLTFGPYLAVAPGRYEVTVLGALRSAGDGAQVDIAVQHGALVLAKADLASGATEHFGDARVLARMTVEVPEDVKDLEVRTFVGAASDLEVQTVEIVPQLPAPLGTAPPSP